MVGVIVVTHGGFGSALVTAAEGILGPMSRVTAVGLEPSRSVDDWSEAISAALDRVDDGDGVLVLADMFGGTPCNLSLRLGQGRQVEVVTGVNLPMVLKLGGDERERSLDLLSSEARQAGTEGVVMASELLRSRLKR